MVLSARSADILRTFEPITLKELGHAELMQRRETKFILPAVQLQPLLEAMQGQYRLLHIAGTAQQGYLSRYFDTPDFAFFHAQHVRRDKRHKVRWRRYASTGAAFLEVKGRERAETTKWRVPSDGQPELHSEFLRDHHIAALDLQAVVDVTCERLTFVLAGAEAERITLDLNLRLIHPTTAEQVSYDQAIIVEVKSSGAFHHTRFAALSRPLHLRPESVSKYAVGVAKLYPEVRSNLILPQVRRLSRQGGQTPVGGS